MQQNPKVYVAVDAHFDIDGELIPTRVTWEDGTIYEVDKVLYHCRAASLKAGGTGVRYTVRFGNRETYLWLEESRWFVERRG